MSRCDSSDKAKVAIRLTEKLRAAKGLEIALSELETEFREIFTINRRPWKFVYPLKVASIEKAVLEALIKVGQMPDSAFRCVVGKAETMLDGHVDHYGCFVEWCFCTALHNLENIELELHEEDLLGGKKLDQLAKTKRGDDHERNIYQNFEGSVIIIYPADDELTLEMLLRNVPSQSSNDLGFYKCDTRDVDSLLKLIKANFLVSAAEDATFLDRLVKNGNVGAVAGRLALEAATDLFSKETTQRSPCYFDSTDSTAVVQWLDLFGFVDKHLQVDNQVVEQIAQMMTRSQSLRSISRVSKILTQLHRKGWQFDESCSLNASVVDFIITCHHIDGFIKCYNVAGEQVVNEKVPLGEDLFGPWLLKEVKKLPKSGRRIRLIRNTGEDIWIDDALAPLASVARSCLKCCKDSLAQPLHGRWQHDEAANKLRAACPLGMTCQRCSEIFAFFHDPNAETLRYSQDEQSRLHVSEVLNKFKAPKDKRDLFSFEPRPDATSDDLECSWRLDVPKATSSACVLILTKQRSNLGSTKKNMAKAVNLFTKCTTVRNCECRQVAAFFRDESQMELKIQANSATRTHIVKKFDKNALASQNGTSLEFAVMWKNVDPLSLLPPVGLVVKKTVDRRKASESDRTTAGKLVRDLQHLSEPIIKKQRFS